LSDGVNPDGSDYLGRSLLAGTSWRSAPARPR